MFDVLLLRRTEGRGYSVNDRSDAVINVIVPSVTAGSTTGHSHNAMAMNAALNTGHHGQMERRSDHSAVGTRDHSSRLVTEQHSSTRQHDSAVGHGGQHNGAMALGRDQHDKWVATEHQQVSSLRQPHHDMPFTEHRSDGDTMREHYDRLANERAHALAEASLLKA